MPDKVRTLPNLRIDIPDFEAHGQGYSNDLSKLSNEKFILDNFSRISEGFRVEIANQATAPGQFTVYGGVAFGRDGQIITNETDLAVARSSTLAVNATYFVEVEFTSSASTTDARAFWDTEYDNGSDPSGDVRPPGRETYANVATRITPDWKIVSPISTTGFQSTTNANSTRIPVAVITLAGGVITGASTSVNKTVLLKTALAADTTIKCVNTRTFPDTFTATVGAAAITVTANDRENGILTLSAGLAAGHTAGERIIQTGVGIPLLLVERTVQSSDVTSGTADQRPRLLQGDEEKGYVYSQDPYTTTGRSDLNLRTNKELFDFYSGQIREMKFGSMRSADLGKTAPPSSFSSPRYFDNAGGLLGARIPTVSVGDGTTVWGDFNTAQYAGSARDAIQAAHDALPARGGIIFIKGKDTPYDISTSTVTISKNIIFMGENAKQTLTSALGTELRGNGAVPALTINADCFVEFYNLKISRNAGATSTAAIVLNNFTVTIRAENCHFFGLLQAAGVLYDSRFTNCTFSTAISGSNNFAFNGTLNTCVFSNCTFANQAGDGAAARALLIQDGSSANLFTNCIFSGSTAGTAVLEIQDDNSDVILEKCKFLGGTLLSPPILVGASCLGIRLHGCDAVTSGNGLISVGEVSGLFIRDCATVMNGAVTGINIGTSSPSQRCEISGCYFTNIGATTTSVGVYVNSASLVRISECTFTNVDTSIQLGNSTDRVTIDNITITNDPGIGVYGIAANAASVSNNLTINNVRINNLGNLSVAYCAGISLDNCNNLSITNCKFVNIGDEDIASVNGVLLTDTMYNVNISNNQFRVFKALTACTGIKFERTALSGPQVNININNNIFREIGDTIGEGRGIYSVSTHEILNINNNQFYIIGSSAGTSANAVNVSGSADSATHNNISVCGNNIDYLRQGIAITISRELDRCIISNNNIIVNNTSSVGIYLVSDAGTAVMSVINISNNNISCRTANFGTGISLVTSAGGTADGKFIINNNTILNFGAIGINVTGTSLNEAVTISGNILDTVFAGTTGIQISTVVKYTVTGNSVITRDTGANANTGILLSVCEDGTISGNDITVTNTLAGWCLNLSGTVRAAISGNHFKILNNHNRGLNASSKCYIVGNIWTGVTANPVTLGGAPAARYTALSITGADNSASNPASVTDIGLNWWGA